MDKRDPRDPREKDLPSHEKKIAEEGEENRRRMDKIPAPGTDPLHEGP